MILVRAKRPDNSPCAWTGPLEQWQDTFIIITHDTADPTVWYIIDPDTDKMLGSAWGLHDAIWFLENRLHYEIFNGKADSQ